MSQQPTESVELSGQESHSLRDYISSHHTTVLTVMFTDIKGYTQLTEEKGEAYVADLRQAHDELLAGIIEADNSGLILKHIGDSVMAVFAEPSRAVDRAIQIQQQLVHFNQKNQQWQDIDVRIGLHMGQVTIEGEVTFDIFGRHVNRAARIESLADGGQIYLSYTVFDSARSWLSHHTDYGWQSHGYYRLKGISEPVEIFEVWDKTLRNPFPPRNAKAIKNKPRFLYLAAAILLGVAITLAVNAYKATELRLKASYPQNLYTADWQKVSLEGNNQDPERRAAYEFSAGEHHLFYKISESAIRYSTITLERGDNLLTPQYKNYSLPALYVRQGAAEEVQTSQKEQRWQYQAVNQKGQLTPYETQVSLQVISQKGATEVTHRISWQLQPIKPAMLAEQSGTLTLSRSLNQKGSEHEEQTLLNFDNQVAILKSSMIGANIQLRLDLEYHHRN